VRIGALVRMADAAADPKVRAAFPVVSQALDHAA
jgi:xanthine dehydrogenase YagS FAD-binding subunit